MKDFAWVMFTGMVVVATLSLLGIPRVFGLFGDEAEAQASTAATCRAYVTALGEPDAPCYCPEGVGSCTIKLSRWLVEASCEGGYCNPRTMAGAAP